MEQSSNNSTSGLSRTPFANIPGKEKSEWRIPSGIDGYHPSIDASLFSRSLPFLPINKLTFNESEQSVQSVDDTFPSLSKLRLEDEVKYPLEDIEPNAIGSFLPGDEEELLAGLIDDFDLSSLPTQLKGLDDDFFGSGGGLEIESVPQENLANGITRLSMSDGINGNIIANYGLPNGFANISSEHPYGEHPSRTLFVRNINSNVDDSELKSLFEQYGDVRTLYTACKHRGFVMISYYDIRAARTAMRALQNISLKKMGRYPSLFATAMLVLMLFMATGTGPMMVAEARICESQSHRFKGPCVRRGNCAAVCQTEGFPGGLCRGFRRRCFCTKHC